MMTSVLQDLRDAARGLARSPGFTAAVATLALGIGTNAALFSVINTMILRPMPGVADPHRLVLIAHNGRRVFYPDALEYGAATRVFAGAAAFDRAPVHVTAALAPGLIGGDR